MDPAPAARLIALAGLFLVTLMTPPAPAADPAIALVPRPTAVVPHDGTFTLTADTTVGDTPEGRLLAEQLRPATGLPLRAVPVATATIRLEQTPADELDLDGAYTLDVTPTVVTVRSQSPAGLFYGGQTFRQLLPPAVFAPTPAAGVAWSAPCVHVEDAPRFRWRGMHLDCARHFFPVAFVERYIDLLALHKMNRFHWHLTDDQGWRIEIKKYPRLTEVGSRRAGSMVFDPADPKHLKFDGVPVDGFYTQDQVREVVAYAAARHVTVVPEIEMPGHSAAAIAAYPWLGVSGQPVDVWTAWGVNKHVLNPTDRTVAFYQDVLAEVIDLFPSPYIHVGGDECPKDEWDASPAVQARIRELGLKDSHAMQSWFIGRMDAYLAAHGRKLIGWDEILEGGLTPGAAVMGWRGDAGAIAAARAGHEVVNASNAFTYLDHYQSKDHAHEPYAIGGYLPLSRTYGFDPMPPGLAADRHRFVLGGQGQVWTEYIATPAHAEYMAYPRGCALAETLWSPAEGKDYAAFRGRLAVHVQRLAAMGVNYRKLDPEDK